MEHTLYEIFFFIKESPELGYVQGEAYYLWFYVK